VAEEVQQAASKSQGRLPGELVRWAKVNLSPPKVDWRQRLLHSIRTACAYRAGAVVYRYDAPSRRQGAIGYGPGKPILPRLRTPVARVAVVADTSGSMGSREVAATLRETRGILKATNSAVQFCACDAQVHSLQSVRTVEELLPLLKGGGGTDFRPAFTALEKVDPQPEVVVFCTDGYGTAPEHKPKWAHVIWLLIGDARAPCDWGEVIKVETEKDK